MSKPRLIYFDFAGSRGEECRIALHLAGVDFEDVRVKGDGGMLKVFNPTGPNYYNRVSFTPTERKLGEPKHHQRVGGEGTTYWYQMRAFVAAVRDGAPVLTPPADAVRNMRVIDAMYTAAGLRPRLPTPVPPGS